MIAENRVGFNSCLALISVIMRCEAWAAGICPCKVSFEVCHLGSSLQNCRRVWGNTTFPFAWVSSICGVQCDLSMLSCCCAEGYCTWDVAELTSAEGCEG